MLMISNIVILKSIFPLLAFIIAWELVWKWIALFRAWKQWEIWRFICIFIFNTIGLLPIIYLLIDSTKKDDIDLPKKNNKIIAETKHTKKITKGGVAKWENAMQGKKQKEMQNVSWKKRQKKSTKKM